MIFVVMSNDAKMTLKVTWDSIPIAFADFYYSYSAIGVFYLNYKVTWNENDQPPKTNIVVLYSFSGKQITT